MERLEFGSPAWMAYFHERLANHLSTHEPNATLTRCEVYRNAPAHLCASGSDSLTWTCRNECGRIRFELREASIDEADVKTEGDYEAFRELVRFVVDDGNANEFQALVLSHVDAGRIRPLKDTRGHKPPPNWALHNDIAARTR